MLNKKFQSSAICFLGPPASGKGTVAAKLAEKFNLPIFLPGAIYRELREQDTEIGRLVKESLKDGGICPNELTNRIMDEELTRYSQTTAPLAVIMDGFPRSLAQLEHLEEKCHIATWIYLTCDYEVLEQRVMSRRECARCAYVTTLSKIDPVVGCVACGHKEPQWKVRFDDTPEFFRKRYDTYMSQTQPIIDLVQGKMNYIVADTHRSPQAYEYVEGFVEAALKITRWGK